MKKFKILREDKIRSDKFKKKLDDAYKKDLSFLLSKKNFFHKVNCPACNSKKSEIYFVKNKLKYKICTNCLTIYISPRPTNLILSKFYFQSKGYQVWNSHVFPESEKTRRKELVLPRIKSILDYMKKIKSPFKSALEIGPGFGTFSESLKKRKIFEQISVVEPNKELSKTCFQKGLNVFNESFEKLNLKNKFSLVSSFEVLEHLHSPKFFLQKIFNLLEKKGVICLSLPNGFGFDNLIMGKYSQTFDHEHLNYFNPNSLNYLLSRIGFKNIQILTPGKLDTELVLNYILKKKNLNITEKIIYEIFYKNSMLRNNNILQKFLFENKLSGHMFVLANK